MITNPIMKIRIEDYNLTVDDIIKFPIWKYALDEEAITGQDERTVRPYRGKNSAILSELYIE